MQSTKPTPPKPHASTRKWQPVMMDQLMCRDDHPGDNATGLMEWLALWRVPTGPAL